MRNSKPNSDEGNDKGQDARTWDRFAALNRLVDGGWLGNSEFTPRARSLWMCLYRHADAEGVCWPSNTLLMRELGQASPRHVQRDKNQLVTLGLLEREAVGGGREVSKYRLLIPPPMAKVATGGRSRHGAKVATAPVAETATAGMATDATAPVATFDAPYKEEQNIEQPKGRTKRTAQSVSDADCESIYREYPKKKSPEDAYKAIRKAIPLIAKRGEASPVEWLRNRVKAYAKARRQICDADPSQKRFTPYPASWINARGYDEPDAEWEASNDEPVLTTENGFVRKQDSDAEIDALLGDIQQKNQQPQHAVKIGGKENICVPILK